MIAPKTKVFIPTGSEINCCKCGKMLETNRDAIRRGYFDNELNDYVVEHYCSDCDEEIISEMIQEKRTAASCRSCRVIGMNIFLYERER